MNINIDSNLITMVKLTILCSLSLLLLFSSIFGSAINNTFAQVFFGNESSTGSNNTNATTPTLGKPLEEPGTTPTPSTTLPTLKVISHIIGRGSSTVNITLIITNLVRTHDGFVLAVHFVRGSADGTTVNLLPGIFSVADQRKGTNISIQPYNTTFSGDCNTHKTVNGTTFGSGSINPGEAKTCIVSNYFSNS